MLVIHDLLVYFTQCFIGVGLKLALVVVFIRLTMAQTLMQHEKLEMFLIKSGRFFVI